MTIRNEGKGIATCPLDLQTTEGAQRERFAVSEGETCTSVWQTASHVTNVVIDPDHTTLQGDAKDKEARLRLLALPDTALQANWPLYWKGEVHAEAGDYSRAEALFSRVISEWRNWWEAHRTSFQPGPEAGHLSPGGIREVVSP